MELFERVLYLEGVLGSRKAIAEAMGITPQKMWAYSNQNSQKNLWPLLPKLIEKIPDLSRDWLYFEEGEMFRRSGDMSSNTEASHAAILENQAETIRTLTETNRRLTEELLALRRSL